MKKKLVYKDPIAILSYELSWDVTGAIAQSTWSVDPIVVGGLAVQSIGVSNNTATALISGGIEGERYTVINQIETDQGERDRRHIQFKIQKAYVSDHYLSYIVQSSQSTQGGTMPDGISSTIRVPSSVSATGAGVIAEGAQSVTIANIGSGAGTVLGQSLPVGASASWSVVAGADMLGAIAYDATGTTFLIFTVR